MKAHAPLTYGLPETLRLRRRARNDPLLQQILHYIEQQEAFLNRNVVLKNPDYPTSVFLHGHVKIGFHNHFPKRRGWYSRSLKAFNPDRLEDFARAAYLQGFDVVTVSNYYDDQIFGHEPGVVFTFNDHKVIVLKSQEVNHVLPFGYYGRIKSGSIDDVVNSTTEKGGLVIMCHPSNLAYNGAGEDLVRRYGEKVVIETHSPLVNHPGLFFRFADILAKEWSLAYGIPGVSVQDSHNLYFYGGFFVPMEYLDISSPQSAMQSLSHVFEMRRNELQREHSLTSDYIINTEEYPTGREVLGEFSQVAVTSLRHAARKVFISGLGLKNKNIGLRNFDYRGPRKNNLDVFDGHSHVYLLKGENPAKDFLPDTSLSPHNQQIRTNLVFFRKGGRLYIGTTFTDFRGYGEHDSLEFALRPFNGLQSSFLEEILSDDKFHDFKFGLHPAYPIACITPNGQKYMFVAKEFLPQYAKGRRNARLFFWLLDKFVYKGEEGQRMAALQSTVQNEGVNIIPPLYLEVSKGKSRLVYPYVRLESLSKDFSQESEIDRREILDHAADQLAQAKSRGVYLTDMHLGNIAKDAGDWFYAHDGKPIIPDITVPGSSVITFGESSHNLINPFSLFSSPRTVFVWKARRRQHRLIQNFDDFAYFMKSYSRKLGNYREINERTK